MFIVEKNEGKKIPYIINGSRISLNDMLTIDLKKYQKDEERVIDISLNDDEMLQMGLGKWYIANISIPPKEYELIKVESTSGEDDEVKYDKKEIALDMEKVTLTLWAVPTNFECFEEVI